MTDKPWAHVSATQINNFRACPRKWYLRSIAKVRYPPSPAMLAGQAIHATIERVLKAQVQPVDLDADHAKLVKAADLAGFFDGFDANRPTGELELDIRTLGLRLADVPVLGYIDCLWREDDVAFVRDWKLRSSFSYAPTPDELHDDTQAIIYGKAVLTMWPDIDVVDFGHGNLLRLDKGGPAAKLTTTRIDREEIDRKIKFELDPIVFDMRETSRAQIRSVRPQKSACFVYGRCEYYDECHAIPYAPIGAPTPENTMVLDLDALLGPPAPKPVEAVAPAPAPAPATPAPEPEPVAPVVVAEQPAPSFIPPDIEPDRQPVTFADLTVADFDWTTIEGIGAKGASAIVEHLAAEGITHLHELGTYDLKELPTVGAKTASAIRDKLTVLGGGVPETINEKIEEDEKGFDLVAKLKAATEAVKAGEVPDLTGVPEKNKTEFLAFAKKWREAMTPDYDQPIAEQAPKPTPAPRLRARTVLYINCVPIKGTRGVVQLDDLLAPLQAQVCAELEVPYWDLLPYAEGGKRLAAKVVENIDQFTGRSIVAFDKGVEIPRILGLLMGRADVVIKGS